MWRAPKVTIRLDRRSVCAGDDGEPHGRTLAVDRRWTLAGLVHHVVDLDYLPTIAGGAATWVLYVSPAGLPAAVVAQQWRDPAMVLRADTPLEELVDEDGTISLECVYLDQRDPTDVVGRLLGGRAPR